MKLEKVFIYTLLLLLAVQVSSSRASEPMVAHAQVTEVAVPEEVLVIGRRPGPPLWRAMKGDHTLWIFGTLTPLPKGMEWDPDSLKHIISESQAYLEPPDVNSSTANPFKGIRILRQFRKAQRLTNGESLESVLDPALFEQFLRVKAQYAPQDKSLHALRPMFAADRLRANALKSAKLSGAGKLQTRLARLARRGNLVMLSSTVQIDVERIVGVLKAVPIEREADCLKTALDSIGTDLQASIDRAIAWSRGDATALRKLNYPDVDESCRQPIAQVPLVQAAERESRQLWLQHAESALANNRSTLASLPVRELVRPDGLLAELQRRGYTIRGQ